MWHHEENKIACVENNILKVSVELEEGQNYICSSCYKNCYFLMRNGIINHSYNNIDITLKNLVKELLEKRQTAYRNVPLALVVQEKDFEGILEVRTMYTSSRVDFKLNDNMTIKERNDTLMKLAEGPTKVATNFIDSIINTSTLITENKIDCNLTETDQECECKEKMCYVDIVNEVFQNKFVDFLYCTSCKNISIIKKTEQIKSEKIEEENK